MSVTGLPLLVLLLVLSAAFPIAALVAWSRWRRRVLTVLACAVLVLAGQVAAVGLVAGAVNRSGQYYTSWPQLVDTFSTSSTQQPITRAATTYAAGTTPRTAGSFVVRADNGFSTPAQWDVKGRLDAVTVKGASSGLTSHTLVFEPPEYFQPAYQHTRFPVAEVLSGYPGNAHNLVNLFKFPEVLRTEIAAGQARPMVLVMTRPSLSYRRDLECTNVPAGPQTLTFLAQDLRSAISRHLRVEPTGWGAIGDSTGGYCAAKLAMTYPADFRAGVSLSGFYTAVKDSTTGDLWGGSKTLRDLNDLQWRLQHQPAPATSLLVTISKQEGGPLGHENTERFLSLVKAPMVVDSIITPTGGHDVANWARLLPRSLHWLSDRLPEQEVVG